MRPWQCMMDALRSFTWRSYVPLLPILIAQLLYLVLALNLGQAWGMATAGAIGRWAVGPSAINYPASLEILPLTSSYVETWTFLIGGAFALPLLAAAVRMTLPGGEMAAEERSARLRVAYPATFLALGAAFAVTLGWQDIVVRFLPRTLASFLGQPFQVSLVTWTISVLVGYAIITAVVYVPIAALDRRAGLGGTLRTGLQLGLRYFWKTYPLFLLLSLPALALQLVAQLGGSLLLVRTRPENAAYVLFAYAVLSSVATYFAWNMATRIHHAAGGNRS